MKKNLALILYIVIVLLFSGSAYNGSCASAGTLNEDKKDTKVDSKVLVPQEKEEDTGSCKIRIISKPSGAIIEVENVYVGETPLTILTTDKILQNVCIDSYEGWSRHASVLIKATPKNDGYTQSKFIACKQLTQDITVFFDMRLEPVKK